MPFLTSFTSGGASGSMSRSRSMSSPLNWARRYSGSISPITWAERGQQQQLWQQAPSASSTGAGPDSDAVFSGQLRALVPFEFDYELQATAPLQATGLHRSVTSDSIRGESLQVEGATRASSTVCPSEHAFLECFELSHVLLPGAQDSSYLYLTVRVRVQHKSKRQSLCSAFCSTALL